MAKNTNKEIITLVTTNAKTGEVFSTNTLEVKPGSGVKVTSTSEAQRESYKHKQELIKEIKEFIAENEGAYVHLIFRYGSPLFHELEEKAPGNKNNIHVIRFMMLATCLTFGGNLFDDNRNRIKKSSLKNIWDVQNRNSINETYDILLECGYIYETEEGYIMVNEDLIVKGAIDNFEELRKQGNSFTYTRVFVDNLKAMYEGTESKQRKQLANLFKALPYINFKYNVFCANPTETDEDKVEPLTWTDLARLCGYEDKKNIAKFKKDLMNLSIFNRSVVGQFETKSGKVIVVNPKVYYGGDDVNDVKGIQSLFNFADGKNK